MLEAFFRKPDEDELDQPIVEFICSNAAGLRTASGWSYPGLSKDLPKLTSLGWTVKKVVIHFRKYNVTVFDGNYNWIYFSYGAWGSAHGSGGGMFSFAYGNDPLSLTYVSYTVPVMSIFNEEQISLHSLNQDLVLHNV